MKKAIYEEFVRVIQAFEKGEQNLTFNNNVLQENQNFKGSEVVFTLKNYHAPKGFSNRITNFQNDLFQVKCMMGKNLGLNATGTHVAFVGGTGILVFSDLIAYMIRLNLGLLNEGDENILDKHAFKFVLYASFARPEEVIGGPLLAGLQMICEKKGLKNFELIYRFSNQKPPRWDENFIERQL